jgi:hypothetical protein
VEAAAAAAADMAGASGREPLLRSEIHGFITYAGRPLHSERRNFSFVVLFPFLSVIFFGAVDSVAVVGFVVRALLFEA